MPSDRRRRTRTSCRARRDAGDADVFSRCPPGAELRTGAGGPLLVIRGLRRTQPCLSFLNRPLALALGLFLPLRLFGRTLRRFGGTLGLLGGSLGGDCILPRLLFRGSLGALLFLSGLPPVSLRLLRRGLLRRLPGLRICAGLAL